MMLQKLEYSKNNEYFCTINYLNDEIMTIMKKTRLLMMLLKQKKTEKVLSHLKIKM